MRFAACNEARGFLAAPGETVGESEGRVEGSGMGGDFTEYASGVDVSRDEVAGSGSISRDEEGRPGRGGDFSVVGNSSDSCLTFPGLPFIVGQCIEGRRMNRESAVTVTN